MKQTNTSKIYLEKDVLTSSRERISMMFDSFENIWVSVSGGKDSTVLFDLVIKEAVIRNRRVNLFFIDQEAEYESSIDIIRDMMTHPNVIPYWFQIPLKMTCAVSYEAEFMNTWCPDEKDLWMRDQDDLAIKEYDNKSDRFYDFIHEMNNSQDDACWFVGLRSEESLNRFRTMKKDGWDGHKWTTNIDGRRKIINAYPLYDWTFEDIWKYIFEFDVKYNSIYDKQFMSGYKLSEMRVSNLIHEMSYKCLVDLPKFEPDTYNRLQRRLPGIATAQRYAKKIQVFNAGKLPKDFDSYQDWRNNLLLQLPLKPERKKKFKERFLSQVKRYGDHEWVYKHHVRQLLMNDWENSLTLTVRKEETDPYAKWKEIL